MMERKGCFEMALPVIFESLVKVRSLQLVKNLLVADFPLFTHDFHKFHLFL